MRPGGLPYGRPPGGGVPLDAPRARIERYTEVPGEVFQVIREALGRDDRPEAMPPMENAVEQFEDFVEIAT